jgi:hypothetical protein
MDDTLAQLFRKGGERSRTEPVVPVLALAPGQVKLMGLLFAGAMLEEFYIAFRGHAASGPSAIPAGETIIWQHWAMGDAVVNVPGYDIKILPPSGVIAEAVLWMTESEMLRIEGGAARK